MGFTKQPPMSFELRPPKLVDPPHPGRLRRLTEELAEEGSHALERGEPDVASGALARALALWRGPALADLADEPGLTRVAGRLDELRVLALERRIEAELALGHHADVVGQLAELIAEHPLRERPRGLLMTALSRSGQQAEALVAFREARSTLHRYSRRGRCRIHFLSIPRLGGGRNSGR